MVSPARRLLGTTLSGGWKVVQEVVLGTHATGGTFSAGYIVERGSERAFLKALDYSSATLPRRDTPAELRRMTTGYLFETWFFAVLVRDLVE
jgi:hypothetical protein